ncbi:MAG: hypothetical protein FOGNACKC_04836 [Anaerolineae bacterium]|nr:hypothetical protein [Anaerolineae bacterium]
MKDRKVIIELSEHDARQLLKLLEHQLRHEDKIWHSYWTRLSQTIQQSIEYAYRNDP